MFGYVNVNRDDLTKEQGSIYQSYYCGLCHVLRERSGRKGQLLLNYDMTFLILLLTGLYELEDQTEKFVCAIHPATRRVLRINEATAYAADMNVLLSYQNFADDYRDNRSRAKHLAMKVYQKEYDRIFAQYPRQGQAVERCMKKLWEAEENKESNIDLVAGITGEMLGEIFVWKEDAMWAQDLRSLGFYLGKFIYLMDAYEDVEKDWKEKNFNVFLSTWRKEPEDFDTLCKMILVSMMGECARTFERMPVILHAEIIRNILYSGVWTRFELTNRRRHKEEYRQKKKECKERQKIRKKQQS